MIPVIYRPEIWEKTKAESQMLDDPSYLASGLCTVVTHRGLEPLLPP